MGMLYKRGKTWWLKYYQNGKPFFESAQTDKKMVAQKLLQQREGEIAQGKMPGVHFEKTTFDDLAEDLLSDYRINEKNVETVETKVKHLKAFFGGMKAKQITTPLIKKYIEQRQQEQERDGKTIKAASNATINRELAALKRMLNMGAKQTPPVVDRVPHIPMLAERNVRTGFFDHSEFLALRDAMPEHLKGVLTFGYKTGWRLNEITSLTWANFDAQMVTVTLNPKDSKNSEGRLIYLDDELKEVCKQARSRQKQLATVLPWVFLNEKGTDRVKRFYKAWKTACKKAGIGLRIFHDFRRTAVRNMVRAGIPERVAMQISGHKTRSVFERYNIVSESDLMTAARRQQEYLENQPTVTKMVTITDLNTRKTACPRSSGG
jgi:integrase